MLSHRGGGTHLKNSAWQAGCLPIICVTALLAFPAAGAQHHVPLTLANAEDLALRNEPGQSGFLARAEALNEQAVAAAQLPDPVFRVGVLNFPIESGGFSTEAMSQGQLGVRQSFPPGKTRPLSLKKFQSLSSEMALHADARARDVLTAVRTAWLESYYWERAHETVSEARKYFEDLVEVTRSLYAAGKNDQQDVLRAELELSRIDDRLIDIDRHQRASRAALSQWVGQESLRPLARKMPDWSNVPDLQALIEGVARHPMILAADARVDAHDASVRLAEERFKAGWAVDLSYGYRDGLLPNGSPRSDFVSLSVSVDLPFFRKNRQDRNFAAAMSERRAADHSREAEQRRLSSRLEAELARWQELSKRIELYKQRILIQARSQSDAALAAYRSEAGDFADVMRAEIDELNARLDLERLQIEQAQTYAVLANLGGLSP